MLMPVEPDNLLQQLSVSAVHNALVDMPFGDKLSPFQLVFSYSLSHATCKDLHGLTAFKPPFDKH